MQTEEQKKKADYMREYTREHKEKINAQRKQRREANKKRIASVRRAWGQRNPTSSLYQNAKARAKRLGLDFTISREDIVIPEYCPALGIKLEVGEGGPKRNSPSVDRIKPELGYVPGNIVVVSHKANSMKNDATLEEMKKLVAFYETIL